MSFNLISYNKINSGHVLTIVESRVSQLYCCRQYSVEVMRMSPLCGGGGTAGSGLTRKGLRQAQHNGVDRTVSICLKTVTHLTNELIQFNTLFM